MVKLRGFDITSYSRSCHSACMNKAEMGPENKVWIDLGILNLVSNNVEIDISFLGIDIVISNFRHPAWVDVSRMIGLLGCMSK
ncbi:hypothetical protein DEO72_LG7g432 [Vigna unguiculata]|uniref:Uncharacterized protein n=1 Tax=Vigna unguiculata TaxID=3917 RepID=A0A4D6MFB9_VIGUN|nr:hypothetical protein DEO72_LG7g432 [Vigna unguiculata]